MKPIIFLDIDGVLCTVRATESKQQRGLMQYLDPVSVGLLNFLLKDSGAELVLSSTWRLHHSQMSMSAILQNAGLIDVPWHQNWKTSNLDTVRGYEIDKWFEMHGKPEKYLILDDDKDFLQDQMEHVVLTDCDEGISWKNYLQARKILGLDA